MSQTLEQAARALLSALEKEAEDREHYYREIADLRAALAAESGRGSGWQPIETAPKGRKVIVGYRNSLGKWRTVMGCYYLAGTLESDADDSGWAPEGWYEESETHEDIMPCDCEPTHWQPLPEPPTDVLAAAQEGSKNGS